MTSTTMAALAIVDGMDGASEYDQHVHQRHESRKLTHSNNVPLDIVTEREVASDCNQDVDEAS